MEITTKLTQKRCKIQILLHMAIQDARYSIRSRGIGGAWEMRNLSSCRSSEILSHRVIIRKGEGRIGGREMTHVTQPYLRFLYKAKPAHKVSIYSTISTACNQFNDLSECSLGLRPLRTYCRHSSWQWCRGWARNRMRPNIRYYQLQYSKYVWRPCLRERALWPGHYIQHCLFAFPSLISFYHIKYTMEKELECFAFRMNAGRASMDGRLQALSCRLIHATWHAPGLWIHEECLLLLQSSSRSIHNSLRRSIEPIVSNASTWRQIKPSRRSLKYRKSQLLSRLRLCQCQSADTRYTFTSVKFKPQCPLTF